MDFSQVTISTLAFDPLGFLTFPLLEQSSLLNVSRRVTILSTLDGGTVADDAGATDKDREFALSIKPKDILEAEQIKYLTLQYPSLMLSTREGLFRCIPLRADFADDKCTWHLRVMERIA